jgi:bifunctional DNase/RNase
VEKVVVGDLTDHTFDALIPVRTATGPVAIDARPGNAIAPWHFEPAPILVERITHMPIIILRDRDGQKVLPI